MCFSSVAADECSWVDGFAVGSKELMCGNDFYSSATLPA